MLVVDEDNDDDDVLALDMDGCVGDRGNGGKVIPGIPFIKWRGGRLLLLDRFPRLCFLAICS